MSTYVSDTETIRNQADQIENLRAQLRLERERRVLTALWGSRDEDCPRPFSLYRPDDVAAIEGLNAGIVGYGCMFADGFTVVRRTDLDGAPQVEAYTTFGDLEDMFRPRGTYVAWLLEDLDDFTSAVTESVERSFRQRAQTDSVRITVHNAINAAARGQLTWAECGPIADQVLTALFGVDES